jgi:hypothetical protein
MTATTEPALLLDSSVLVNFLRVDRMDLLLLLRTPLFVTNHVREEITADYPEQLERLVRALQVGSLQEVIVDDSHEVASFVELSQQGIGSGECSAIAVAGTRGWPLALEDRKAARVALSRFPAIQILKTQDLMVRLLRDGALSILEADALLEDWRTNHRFRLKIASFKDLLPDF